MRCQQMLERGASETTRFLGSGNSGVADVLNELRVVGKHEVQITP